MRAKFSDLVGCVLASVEDHNHEEIVFTEAGGRRFRLYHSQDCCESVTVEDITGDLEDLTDSPIIMAEESSRRGGFDFASVTWTFYRLATVNGYVTIRWFGSSNGYYSERVDFEEMS